MTTPDRDEARRRIMGMLASFVADRLCDVEEEVRGDDQPLVQYNEWTKRGSDEKREDIAAVMLELAHGLLPERQAVKSEVAKLATKPAAKKKAVLKK